MANIVEIDGSVLEGGGQILRMSVAFSAILGIPVQITNIRASRKKPGLAEQHTKGIQLVGQMCQAKMRGVSINSTEIEFIPGRLRGGEYLADIQTAGSISLLLQVALPCALFSDGPATLRLRGGTNTDMAPQVDYVTEVFRPALERFGASFDFDLDRRGYFPRGGGAVTAHVSPRRSLRAVNMTSAGRVVKVHGWSFVAGSLPASMAREMSAGAKQELLEVTNNTDIEEYKETREVAPDNGNGIILVAETTTGCILGGSAIGRRGAGAGGVGRAAGAALKADIQQGGCLDTYAQDQVIIFMALAEGRSSIRVGALTLHTRTAIHIAEMLAKVKFEVTPDGTSNIIECTGLGLINNNLPAS